ncbi:MAG: iron-sulfur cluster assembly scaffold protein [Bacilli bacterium]
MDENLRREIILDSYKNPYNKKDKVLDKEDYIKINTSSESCIDDLNIYFKVENNIIKDICFEGEACAISTSATSIILRKLVGKNINEVKKILVNYQNMINEKPYDKDLLEELIVYDNIQPNRKGCALIPANAIEKLIKGLENEN